LPGWPYYKRKRRILARASSGKVPLPLAGTRRKFLRSLCRSALVLPFERILALALPVRRQQAASGTAVPASPPSAAKASQDLGVTFLNVAKESGLNAKTIFGGEHKNKYLLETTGCGVAFYDYDNDGWLDIFLVNGTRLEGFPAGQEPNNHLFKNNRDGTFTDVTAKAGLIHSGWGQGVCIGDYDNDGFEDLFVTYFGKNVLYHNMRNGSYVSLDRDDPYVLAYLRKNSGSGDSILVVLNMSGEPRTVKFDLASLGFKARSAKTLLASPETAKKSESIMPLTIPPFGVFVGSVH
jgi:VCBS repeat protein/maltogenic amylase-like protein